MLYFVVALFGFSLLIVLSVLKKSERVAIKNRAITEKEEAHIDEEMVIHQALERAGALPNHHHKEEAIRKKNSKKSSIYYQNLFYLFGYMIIFIELWLIYKNLLRILS
jgi:hypothetical protein